MKGYRHYRCSVWADQRREETKDKARPTGATNEIARILDEEWVFWGVRTQRELDSRIPVMVRALARHGIDATPGKLVLGDTIVIEGWNFAWQKDKQ